MEENWLNRDIQHGFVRAMSYLTSLIEIFEKAIKVDVVVMMRIDVASFIFSKAFDMVPHGRLIQKIKMFKMHGIHGDLVIWIQNWFFPEKADGYGGRTLFRFVTSGGLQGFVLGPLLFMIYMNHLDVYIDGLVNKIADGTKIAGVIDSKEGCQSIQWDIDQLQKRVKWQMEFNPSKCEALHFGKLNARGKYTINSKTLNSINVERDLGLQLHSSLKVATQIDRV